MLSNKGILNAKFELYEKLFYVLIVNLLDPVTCY